MEMSKTAMLDHDRVARTMGLFRNLRHTQHPERYSFVFCLFHYKAVNRGKFHKQGTVSGEQKLREIEKRIWSVVPESKSKPRSPNDSLRAVVEQLGTTFSGAQKVGDLSKLKNICSGIL